MKMRSLSFFLAFCLLQDQSEAFGPSTLRIQKNQGFGTNLYAGTLIESGDASKEEGVNDDDIDIKASGSENVSGEEMMISDDMVLDEDKLDVNESSGSENVSGEEIISDDMVLDEDKLDVDEASGSENVSGEEMISDDIVLDEDKLDEQSQLDIEMMQKAIQMAQSSGGERGSHSPFPKPIEGAVIATSAGKVLGVGRSSYEQDAVQAAIANAGISATPLSEWCVNWPSNKELRQDISNSTLYVTIEPSSRRQGQAFPPITQLIQMSGISRVVIGSPDPVPEFASEGAAALHSAGLDVEMGVEGKETAGLIEEYAALTNSKLQKMARKHFESFGRPLGFLHCSVVDSDDVESFARNGNTFGKDFGGQRLSFREFGSYALAPPPESIWAVDSSAEEEKSVEVDNFFDDLDNDLEEEGSKSNPMMPWYEQMDAVVATFPRAGNGPDGDQSVRTRLNGLKWLATNGDVLPANVERILVMDATDLQDLPISNDDENLPAGVDVEAFWRSEGRTPSRVLLRSGDNAQAIAAATAAAEAAGKAAEAAEMARVAIESGDAEKAAEAAWECQEAALAATTVLQREMQISQDLKQRLISLGAKVEVMKGRQPIDVMNHLGKRNGYNAVVWRAGCWGQRGVDAIMDGAFQWVSAHLAVDAVGGKFWQLMLAERAVQAACGAENRVKVLAEQEDFSLEYCDDEDGDCDLTVNGRPIRHIRLDCRVLVIDEDRPHEYVFTKTAPVLDKLTTEAPWFF